MSVAHSPRTEGPPSDNAATNDSTSGIVRDDVQEEVHAARLIKLPPFWKANPSLWFVQVEAIFQLARVTGDDTKFRYVIISLDPEILPFVSDILEAPPGTGRYQAIKSRILSSFGETSETKLRTLLRGNEMGEEKPSNFLQRLRNLAGQACGDSVLRTLSLEQLPESVRAILAIGGVDDLTTLALQADKAMEVVRPTIATVAAATPNGTSDLGHQIEELRKQVKALSTDVRRERSRGRGNSNRRRPRSRSREPRQTQTSCYFHTKFGDKAYKCKPPCTWRDNKGSTEN